MRLIWAADPSDTRSYWETSWLRYLIGGRADVTEIIRSESTVPQDKDILVTSRLTADMQVLFASYYNQDKRYGVILLGDEWLAHSDPDKYPTTASFILRNYYCPSLSDVKNLHYFPLGYKQGFWNGYTGPKPQNIKDRPYRWSFAGAIKGDRRIMIDVMQRATHFSQLHFNAGWNSPDSLTTSQYRDSLLASKFAPSPIGNASVECFRTWEAFEAGCIPILPSVSGQGIEDYYTQLVEACGFTPPPCPMVKDWNEVTAKFLEWDNDPSLQKRCCQWWSSFKNHIKTDIQVLLNEWPTPTG